MKTTVKLATINRGCCVNASYKEIGTLTGVFGVSMDGANDRITIEHTDEVSKEEILRKLREMGYEVLDE